jgi:hypothetical protein
MWLALVFFWARALGCAGSQLVAGMATRKHTTLTVHTRLAATREKQSLGQGVWVIGALHRWNADTPFPPLLPASPPERCAALEYDLALVKGQLAQVSGTCPV